MSTGTDSEPTDAEMIQILCNLPSHVYCLNPEPGGPESDENLNFSHGFASGATKTLSFRRGSVAVAAGLRANWRATATICCRFRCCSHAEFECLGRMLQAA